MQEATTSMIWCRMHQSSAEHIQPEQQVTRRAVNHVAYPYSKHTFPTLAEEVSHESINSNTETSHKLQADQDALIL